MNVTRGNIVCFSLAAFTVIFLVITRKHFSNQFNRLKQEVRKGLKDELREGIIEEVEEELREDIEKEIVAKSKKDIEDIVKKAVAKFEDDIEEIGIETVETSKDDKEESAKEEIEKWAKSIKGRKVTMGAVKKKYYLGIFPKWRTPPSPFFKTSQEFRLLSPVTLY